MVKGQKKDEKQMLRSPEGFKKATSLEIKLAKEAENQPDSSSDEDEIVAVEEEEGEAENGDNTSDISDERVNSLENPPTAAEPPPQKRIAKRVRPSDDDTQRPLVETILNQAQVITLDDVITVSLANSFYDQALRPGFNQKVGGIIMEKALFRCRLKVMGKWKELSLKEGADREWPFI